MDKGGGDLRHGGPSWLMRQTGGDSDILLDKSSKKEKLRRLSSVGILREMDQLSHSISTTKRVKLPKKVSDHDSGTTNHVSAPRKPRSAMKKRHDESQRVCALPDSTDGCINKEKGGGGMLHLQEGMRQRVTKEEEEVAEALFALAQTETHLNACTTTTKVEERMHPKRCWVHVYICRFIKGFHANKEQQQPSFDIQSGDCCRLIMDHHHSRYCKPDSTLTSYQNPMPPHRSSSSLLQILASQQQ